MKLVSMQVCNDADASADLITSKTVKKCKYNKKIMYIYG